MSRAEMLPIALHLVFAAGLTGAEGCIGIAGDMIRAGELSAHVPGLAALPSDAAIGLAPAPGARRFLRAEELGQVLARAGAAGAPYGGPGLCVEVRAAPLESGEVLAALRTAIRRELGETAEARIELVDYIRARLPRGELRFSRFGLAVPANATAASVVYWRGRLQYSKDRSLAVWARVRLAVRRERLAAARDLVPGRPIESSDLRQETHEEFAFAPAGIAAEEEALGRLPRRLIRARETILPAMLAAPKAVDRGDLVEVSVESGQAKILLGARALSGGRTGEEILLENPGNGKRFRAMVTGQNKASVHASPVSRGGRTDVMPR